MDFQIGMRLLWTVSRQAGLVPTDGLSGCYTLSAANESSIEWTPCRLGEPGEVWNGSALRRVERFRQMKDVREDNRVWTGDGPEERLLESFDVVRASS